MSLFSFCLVTLMNSDRNLEVKLIQTHEGANSD